MSGPGGDWAPDAGLDTLAARARILAKVRAFFCARGVMEADVPALSAAAALEPALQSIRCDTAAGPRYLHSSPEFGLKRLLAAGAGSLYQLAHVYRDGEAGRWHNPEFLMLEWYRPGWGLPRLLDEVDALFTALAIPVCRRVGFAEVFAQRVGADPHAATAAELRRLAADLQLAPAGAPADAAPGARAFWLDAVLGLVLGPGLGHGQPCVVHDWPAELAGLVRIRPGPPAVAERFEVYWQGVELANGGVELTDAAECAERFRADQKIRKAAGMTVPPADERLLAAMAHGLPACAGVALGVDRLLALKLGFDAIAPVMPFGHARA